MRTLIHICGVASIIFLICSMAGWLDSQETQRAAMYGWPGHSVSIESSGGWVHLDYSRDTGGAVFRQGGYLFVSEIGPFTRSYTHWYSTDLLVVGGRYRHAIGGTNIGDIESSGIGVRYSFVAFVLIIATSVYLHRTIRKTESEVPTPEGSAI